MLIDSHCHLEYEGLVEDQAGVLSRARAAGVNGFLNISTRHNEWDRVIGTAEREPDVWASVGIHPHEADAHAECQVLGGARLRPELRDALPSRIDQLSAGGAGKARLYGVRRHAAQPRLHRLAGRPQAQQLLEVWGDEQQLLAEHVLPEAADIRQMLEPCDLRQRQSARRFGGKAQASPVCRPAPHRFVAEPEAVRAIVEWVDAQPLCVDQIVPRGQLCTALVGKYRTQ